MIKFTTESPVTCETCQKPAIRRTVETAHSGLGARSVSYDTHETCVTKDNHAAALRRLDAFHARVHKLESELRDLSESARKLRAGWLVEFNIDTEHPTACEIRTTIVPTAVVRAFGQTAPVKALPRPLKGQGVKSILRDLKAAAGPVVDELERRARTGDH